MFFSAGAISLVRVDGRSIFGMYVGIGFSDIVLVVGEIVSLYLMLFVDRSLRCYVVLWIDHSERYIVLRIVHSGFMLCCGSFTLVFCVLWIDHSE